MIAASQAGSVVVNRSLAFAFVVFKVGVAERMISAAARADWVATRGERRGVKKCFLCRRQPDQIGRG